MDQLEDLFRDIPFEETTFKKGEIIQPIGSTNYAAYYVRSGLLRSYSVDEKGKEHVFMFAPEGWLVGDVESQAKNQPSELIIEALEDSETLVLRGAQVDLSKLTTEQFQEQVKKLVNRVAVLQRRIIMLMSASATKRYEHFIETYPDIAGRVPQRMIASYLGITPEALSKLRGELARGKG